MNARGTTQSVDVDPPDAGAGGTGAGDVQLLKQSVGYMLRRAQLAVFQDFGEALADLGLRPAQFGVLSVLDRNPGVKQSHVCAALGIRHANFVSIIGSLERRGLVQRAASATDRRSKSLSLTPTGRRALERASEIQRLHETRIGQRLGPGGRAQLLKLLDRLVDSA